MNAFKLISPKLSTKLSYIFIFFSGFVYWNWCLLPRQRSPALEDDLTWIFPPIGNLGAQGHLINAFKVISLSLGDIAAPWPDLMLFVDSAMNAKLNFALQFQIAIQVLTAIAIFAFLKNEMNLRKRWSFFGACLFLFTSSHFHAVSWPVAVQHQAVIIMTLILWMGFKWYLASPTLPRFFGLAILCLLGGTTKLSIVAAFLGYFALPPFIEKRRSRWQVVGWALAMTILLVPQLILAANGSIGTIFDSFFRQVGGLTSGQLAFVKLLVPMGSLAAFIAALLYWQLVEKFKHPKAIKFAVLSILILSMGFFKAHLSFGEALKLTFPFSILEGSEQFSQMRWFSTWPQLSIAASIAVFSLFAIILMRACRDQRPEYWFVAILFACFTVYFKSVVDSPIVTVGIPSRYFLYANFCLAVSIAVALEQFQNLLKSSGPQGSTLIMLLLIPFALIHQARISASLYIGEATRLSWIFREFRAASILKMSELKTREPRGIFNYPQPVVYGLFQPNPQFQFFRENSRPNDVLMATFHLARFDGYFLQDEYLPDSISFVDERTIYQGSDLQPFYNSYDRALASMSKKSRNLAMMHLETALASPPFVIRWLKADLTSEHLVCRTPLSQQTMLFDALSLPRNHTYYHPEIYNSVGYSIAVANLEILQYLETLLVYSIMTPDIDMSERSMEQFGFWLEPEKFQIKLLEKWNLNSNELARAKEQLQKPRRRPSCQQFQFAKDLFLSHFKKREARTF